MILSAQSIAEVIPLTPIEPRTRAFGLTYGLGPAGYDIRIQQSLRLYPHEFRLASSYEQFRMPTNLLGIVHDKSTWARKGLCVQNTVIEPGWRGFLTLELTNHGRDIIDLQSRMPIAQIIFHLLDHDTSQPYEGKYQDQESGAHNAIFEPTKI